MEFLKINEIENRVRNYVEIFSQHLQFIVLE